MKNIMLALLALLFITPDYFAQEKVYVLNKRKTKNRTKMQNRIVEHMNVIKYDPLQTIAGEIKFSYEHVVSDKTSLEISLGPTLEGINNFRFFGNSGDFNSRDRFGLVAEIGYRFYFLDDNPALNRFYVSPVLGYKFYTRKLEANQLVYPDLSNQIAIRDKGYFTFNVGYQSWIAKKFSIDYYAGFGLGFRNEDSYFIDAPYNPETQQFENARWINNGFGGNIFQFNLGVKLGLGFTQSN